jgi:hypothetical protein
MITVGIVQGFYVLSLIFTQTLENIIPANPKTISTLLESTTGNCLLVR